MIQFSPQELAFAERLSGIRRNWLPSDGAKSWPRYHQLVYEGGNKLTFRTTDLRISLVSRLPVEGEDQPWECRAYQENFDHFAKANEEGGRFTLNPSPTHCVLAEKGQCQYPFFRVPVDTPFPALLAMEPDRPAATIPLNKLRLALRFLATSRQERDPTCRLNICSIMPNQQVGTWNDGVFIQTEGPAVEAPINLASSDAVRLGQWVHLLHGRGETNLQIAQAVNELGKKTILVTTPNMDHRFQVLGVDRAFPTEFFTNIQAQETTIRGTLLRKELRMMAGCFSSFINCQLIFHFKKDNDRWSLDVTPNKDIPLGGGPMAIRVSHGPNDVQEVPPFLVSADNLLTAVEYHSKKDLEFTFRQRAKILSLASSSVGDAPNGRGVNQTHVRVKLVIAEA
jgi:hypothetical protein